MNGVVLGSVPVAGMQSVGKESLDLTCPIVGEDQMIRRMSRVRVS
jgi:hypothetical protein